MPSDSSLNDILIRGFCLQCPRCGKSSIFEGVLKVKDHCPSCKLPLKINDSADGPAFVAMSIMGTITVFGVIIMEALFSPEWWVQVAVWLPVLVVGSLLCLMLSKSVFIGMQLYYRPEDFKHDKK